MFQIFLKSLVIGYSGAVMPGSMLTYTIDKSLKSGAKSGFLISFGHLLLELVLVLLAIFGVGSYLRSDLAQIIIGIAGGSVLIYFGFTMARDVWQDKIRLDMKESDNNGKYGNLVVGGAIISASNPYFIFWWAVVGLGLIMEAYNRFGVIGVVVFFIGHMISDISWYGFISWLVSRTRHLISLPVYKGVIVLLSICLAGFGISFLYSSIMRIVPV